MMISRCEVTIIPTLFHIFTVSIVIIIMKRVRLLTILPVVMFCLSVSGQGVEKVKDSKTTYSNIIEMLRGEPGLVIKGNGDGGTMPSMYIRGIGTNTDNYQPLFVVDGLRTDNILYIQPEQVYSITVIRDGTSAIYGMEGANGVIEIKTKAAVEAEKQQAQEKKDMRKKVRKEKKSRKKKDNDEAES